MIVIALIGFAGMAPNGQPFSVSEGEVLELPRGADWLKAGLVRPVLPKSPEKQTVEAPEKTVLPRPKSKGNLPKGR